jgi:hypothetical protein
MCLSKRPVKVIVYIFGSMLACIRFFDEHECVQVSLRETTRYGLIAWLNRVYLQNCVYAILVISIHACVAASISVFKSRCFQARVLSIL